MLRTRRDQIRVGIFDKKKKFRVGINSNVRTPGSHVLVWAEGVGEPIQLKSRPLRNSRSPKTWAWFGKTDLYNTIKSPLSMIHWVHAENEETCIHLWIPVFPLFQGTGHHALRTCVVSGDRAWREEDRLEQFGRSLNNGVSAVSNLRDEDRFGDKLVIGVSARYLSRGEDQFTINIPWRYWFGICKIVSTLLFTRVIFGGTWSARSFYIIAIKRNIERAWTCLCPSKLIIIIIVIINLCSVPEPSFLSFCFPFPFRHLLGSTLIIKSHSFTGWKWRPL